MFHSTPATLLGLLAVVAQHREALAAPKNALSFEGTSQVPCANGELPKAFLAAAQEAYIFEQNQTFHRRATPANINVDVYMHVVASSNTGPEFLKADTLNKQIEELNRNFEKTGFSFTLRDSDWTVNKDWAQIKLSGKSAKPGDPEFEMKRNLRKGGIGALNIYTLPLGGIEATGGKANFPSDLIDGKLSGLTVDGAIMHAGSTPGGYSTSSIGMNKGKLLTHEVGHWLGLLHTFSAKDDCNDGGDFIDDTPASSSKSDGCPTGRNTCGTKNGDPIHNFMDYSSDDCRTEFTQGQIDRMQNLWQQFREPIKDCGGATKTEEYCGTLNFCQLYDLPKVDHDKRFTSRDDCLLKLRPDATCKRRDPSPKGLQDCLRAVGPEYECILYEFDSTRPDDKKFKNRAECLDGAAKSCDLYDQPQSRPDNAFQNGKECLLKRQPDKFCQLYDTDKRPDDKFKNGADCLEATVPVLACMLYDFPTLRPDDKFKNRQECIAARNKSQPAKPGSPSLPDTPEEFLIGGQGRPAGEQDPQNLGQGGGEEGRRQRQNALDDAVLGKSPAGATTNPARQQDPTKPEQDGGAADRQQRQDALDKAILGKKVGGKQ
ncbi:hypothetical protein HIM_09292 [Hirsutella minnesotensis 3608]|uniref:Peptidase M43 pregnancy-associated plasma-A domain-containing protein n=1 Tax=Hirsutella minnesotensis 3608 TaxID=1043627 RepID=A0A0F7ZSG4_9HYPO|nr:hypothetical protein HIM_09292 [Hirsutella minnesotensis 3608]